MILILSSIIIGLIHIFLWVFVLFAFLNKNAAYCNLFIVIPIVFISHILPFHTLTEAKTKLDIKIRQKSNNRQKSIDLDQVLILPKYIKKVRNNLKNYCFASPFSPQGMLLIGAITSAFVLIHSKCD
jgi:hypothetical protein